jgi:hypothetical protein
MSEIKPLPATAQGQSQARRCWAFGLKLIDFRCMNPAQNRRWFCYQHRILPLHLTVAFVGVVFSAFVLPYLWGLIAPPTKVERGFDTILTEVYRNTKNLSPEWHTTEQQKTLLDVALNEIRAENRFTVEFIAMLGNSQSETFAADLATDFSNHQWDSSWGKEAMLKPTLTGLYYLIPPPLQGEQTVLSNAETLIQIFNRAHIEIRRAPWPENWPKDRGHILVIVGRKSV